MKKFYFSIAIFIICLATVVLWILSKPNLNLVFEQPFRSLSQILALLGTVLISFTVLLSTRLKWVERIFGGLDKSYGVHHFLGSTAFLFVLHHPILLALQSLPQIKLTILYLLPSSDIAYSLGVIALYLMITSFIFMVFIKLPYHIWKTSHRLLGFGFLLASLHILLITSDISNSLLLRLWIIGFLTLGIGSVIYKYFLYSIFGPKYNYIIEKIERTIDVTTIYLRSKISKRLDFQSGQFVYVSFKNKITGSESHPFSIVSGQQDNLLRLSAKTVGDYTLKMTRLRKGDQATVYGPYGGFTMQGVSGKNCLWIAGGIGATPFLSMLSSESNKPSNNLIYFYYTYSKKEEGIFVNEIKFLVNKTTNVQFHDWCSQEKNRLTVKEIMNSVNIHLLDAIFMCGPLLMMEGIKKQFLIAGIPEQKIIYENFSFL